MWPVAAGRTVLRWIGHQGCVRSCGLHWHRLLHAASWLPANVTSFSEVGMWASVLSLLRVDIQAELLQLPLHLVYTLHH
jgi:hypothetical protein